MTTKSERWGELRDRQALGETLTAAELAECEQLEGSDMDVALEANFYSSLEGMLEHGGNDPAADKLVEAALSKVNADADTTGENPLEEVTRLTQYRRQDAVEDTDDGPRWIRQSAWAAVAAMAAAAVFALATFDPQDQGATPSGDASSPAVAGTDPKAAPTNARPGAPEPAVRTPQVVALAQAHVGDRGSLYRQGEQAALAQADALSEGTVVETRDAAACLRVDPGVDVCMAAASRVRLAQLQLSERVLEVQAGRVVASLQPQPANATFSLSHGVVRATATGTVFGMWVDDTGLDVRVVQGRIEVAAQGEQAALESGQAARMVDGRFVVRKLPSASVQRAWALAGTGERAGSAERARRVARAGKPRSHTETGQGASGPQDMIKRAWELLKEQRWADAAKLYQDLRRRYPGSPEAHAVLVRLGDLQLQRLGQAKQALASFELYLQKGGRLVSEARHGRIRALRKLGRAGAERAAIQEYLREHPKSLKATALRRRLAELNAR